MSVKDYSWIGKRLRQLRRERGLTGRDIANAVGIGQSTISQIETYRQLPNIQTLDAICQALGITLADFFAVDSREEIPQDIRKLCDKARYLKPEQRDALIRLIETMIDHP